MRSALRIVVTDIHCGEINCHTAQTLTTLYTEIKPMPVYFECSLPKNSCHKKKINLRHKISHKVVSSTVTAYNISIFWRDCMHVQGLKAISLCVNPHIPSPCAYWLWLRKNGLKEKKVCCILLNMTAFFYSWTLLQRNSLHSNIMLLYLNAGDLKTWKYLSPFDLLV